MEILAPNIQYGSLKFHQWKLNGHLTLAARRVVCIASRLRSHYGSGAYGLTKNRNYHGLNE